MVARVAVSGAREASKVARSGPEAPGILRRRLLQRSSDGGGHGGHAGDVVPEVRVGVAPGHVEHLRRVDDTRASPVSAEERAHPGVVAGAVLNHDLRRGERGGVGRIGLEEVGVGVGVRDERRDLDVPPAELAGDVAPEVLGRHDVHDVRRGLAAAPALPPRPSEAAVMAAPARTDRARVFLITVTVIISDKACKGYPCLAVGGALSRRRAGSSRRRGAGGARRRRRGSPR